MDGFKELRGPLGGGNEVHVRGQLLAACIYDVARARFCLCLSGEFCEMESNAINNSAIHFTVVYPYIWTPTPYATRPSTRSIITD